MSEEELAIECSNCGYYFVRTNEKGSLCYKCEMVRLSTLKEVKEEVKLIKNPYPKDVFCKKKEYDFYRKIHDNVIEDVIKVIEELEGCEKK